MSYNDLINEQNAMKAHSYELVLWTEKWSQYNSLFTHNWQAYQLKKEKREKIPKESGIYTLLIQPKIAQHTQCSYLMYVGKSKSLRTRFGQYLTSERKETGRPKISRLLNIYDDYLWFCFTLIPENDLDTVEQELISAYIPAFNDSFPGRLSSVKKGAF